MKKLLDQPGLVVTIDDAAAIKISNLANRRNYNYREAGNLWDYQINTGTVYGVGATLPILNSVAHGQRGISSKIKIKTVPPLYNVVPSLTGAPAIQSSYAQTQEWARLSSASNKLRNSDYVGAEVVLGRNLSPNEIQSRILNRSIPSDREKYLRGSKGYYNVFPSSMGQIAHENIKYSRAVGPDANIMQARALQANPQYPRPYEPISKGTTTNVSGLGPNDPVINPTVPLVPVSKNDPNFDNYYPNPTPSSHYQTQVINSQNNWYLTQTRIQAQQNKQDVSTGTSRVRTRNASTGTPPTMSLNNASTDTSDLQNEEFGNQGPSSDPSDHASAQAELSNNGNVSAPDNYRTLEALDNIPDVLPQNVDMSQADSIPYPHELHQPEPWVPRPSNSGDIFSGPLQYAESAPITIDRPLTGGVQSSLPTNMRGRLNMIGVSGPPNMSRNRTKFSSASPFVIQNRENGLVEKRGKRLRVPGTGPSDVFQNKNKRQATTLSSAGVPNIVDIPLSGVNMPLDKSIEADAARVSDGNFSPSNYQSMPALQLDSILKRGREMGKISDSESKRIRKYIEAANRAIKRKFKNGPRSLGKRVRLSGPENAYTSGSQFDTIMRNLSAVQSLLGFSQGSSIPRSGSGTLVSNLQSIQDLLRNGSRENQESAAVRLEQIVKNEPVLKFEPSGTTAEDELEHDAPPVTNVESSSAPARRKRRKNEVDLNPDDLDVPNLEDEEGRKRRQSSRSDAVDKRDTGFRYGKGMIKLGRFAIHGEGLKRNELHVVDMFTGKERHSHEIRPHMSEIITDVAHGIKPKSLSRMNPKEALTLYSMVRDSGSNSHMQLLPPAQNVSMGMKIKIGMGEIDAGNNSTLLKKQLYDNIRLAEHKGLLTKEQYQHIYHKYNL